VLRFLPDITLVSCASGCRERPKVRGRKLLDVPRLHLSCCSTTLRFDRVQT
jgi:hypothetical protein